MNSKYISIVVVIVILAVAGYFGYQAMKENNQSTTQETQNYSTENQSTNQQEETPPVTEQTNTPDTTKTEAPASVVVNMETSEGVIKLTLDSKAAPLTVSNFVKLAKEGFYDGLTFHRIVEGFMIQGGDPKGDGTGGPGYTVPAEIGLKHTKGAIAMARLGGAQNPKKDSSGSQFYITLDTQTFLDGEYTVFGYVTEGLNVVEKIGATPTEPNPYSGEQSVPLKTITIKKVTVQ